MKITTAIRKIMRESDPKWTQTRIAESLGKAQSVIGTRLGSENRNPNKDMTFGLAIEMLNLMGYEVVVQKKGAGKRKDGAIVITKEDDPA